MGSTLALATAAAGLAALFGTVLTVPRILIGKAQDRLARRLVERDPDGFRLLTKAERTVGPRRRLPGVLGLGHDAILFEDLFGEAVVVPTSRIEKIVTGDRMASGRRLLRGEVLRLTRTGGEELEVVLSPDSAAAWRSHLGLWAVAERRAAMDTDTVSPGRR